MPNENVRENREVSPRVLVQHRAGVPAVEAIQLANREKRRILSNREHQQLVAQAWRGSDAHRNGLIKGSLISPGLPAWAGTIVAYASPGKQLGSEIKCWDPTSQQLWRMPVPVGFRELKNAILVAEHPDYEAEIKNGIVSIVVPEGKLGVVENLPAESEWCMTDPVHGIPVGSLIPSEKNGKRVDPSEVDGAARLLRSENGVCLVARGSHRCSGAFGCICQRYVIINNNHSEHPEIEPIRLGVLVEAKEVEVAAREAISELNHLSMNVKPELISRISKLINLMIEPDISRW